MHTYRALCGMWRSEDNTVGPVSPSPFVWAPLIDISVSQGKGIYILDQWSARIVCCSWYVLNVNPVWWRVVRVFPSFSVSSCWLMLIVSFAVQKPYNFTQSHLSVPGIRSCATGVLYFVSALERVSCLFPWQFQSLDLTLTAPESCCTAEQICWQKELPEGQSLWDIP